MDASVATMHRKKVFHVRAWPMDLLKKSGSLLLIRSIPVDNGGGADPAEDFSTTSFLLTTICMVV